MMKKRLLPSRKSNDSFSLWHVLGLALLLIFSANAVQAGTTGKISGVVIDEATGDPLPGANVMIDGTSMGAACDVDGYYYIINVLPGTYTVVAKMIGYKDFRVQNVRVDVDLTTNQDFNMKSSVLEGEEITVVAARPLVQKDLTSKAANITADEIRALPVESFDEVVDMQAGVVAGHFRGGRQGEVAYMVDGIPVNDPYNNSRGVEVENSSIQQLEVISGTFNAEYGQAMSGVVNIITREGSNNKYNFDFSAYAGNYYTNHDRIFPNLDRLTESGSENVQFSVSGPVPLYKKLTFFTTMRMVQDDGYFYGRRIYRTSDGMSANGTATDPFMPTGDRDYVSLNDSEHTSFHGKLTYYVTPSIKINYGLLWDDNENRYYDHAYQQNPDGIKTHYRTNTNHNIQINHSLSNRTFHTLKFSKNVSEYEGYVFEDTLDTRYLDAANGQPASNYTFRSGGLQSDRYDRSSETILAKWDLNSQINKIQKIGLGAIFKQHNIYNHWMDLDTENSLAEEIPEWPDHFTPSRIEYEKEPYEFALYLQDKLEFDNFIINAGLRYDYFNPNTDVPVDTRNPELIELFAEPGASLNDMVKSADTQSQVSPRLGVAFPITAEGVIHVSYGHFFQTPNFEHLYEGITDTAGVSKYYLPRDANLSTLKGNPNLKSQRTVMYEMGLQQALSTDFVMEFTAYYRDIRNLVGTEIIETYDTKKYARYINRDYGNIRGVLLSFEKRFSDNWGMRVDYTYQLAEGNASDPQSVFLDSQSDPPREPEKRLIRLDWDQRSTLNISFTTGKPGNWNLGLTSHFGSGSPYTASSRYLLGEVNFRNNRTKPSVVTFDLRADKIVKVGRIDMTTFVWVENLFDRLNEYGVYGSTGRANNDLDAELNAGEIIGLNTLEDYITNPSMYSAPRRIRLGLSFGF